MRLAEYSKYDGVGLAELVRTRKTTPRELARLFLEAVAKVNPQIKAIIETYDDRIENLETTITSDPFFGVPFLMKDYGAAEKGKKQEMASRLTEGRVADTDSFLTLRFKKAGFNILGRSATPELALAGTTESILTGITRNPWNLGRMTGGSSGGACAAVAAGILPIAHASDAAGSIRIPASACGIVGLKPSRGRVTQGPEFGERPPGVFQEFVVTRTVRDTAVMLDAVSQPAPGDPFIIRQPERPYSKEVNAPLERLRVAWTTQSWQPGTEVNQEVAQTVEEIAAKCKSMGNEVVEASPVFAYEEYLQALCVIFEYGFDASVDALARTMGRKVNEETLEPITLSCYRYAQKLTSTDLMEAEDVLNRLRRSFGQFFEKYDVLITPTLAQPAEPLGKYALTRTDIDFIGYFRLCDEMNMHIPLFNVTGQPAITLPIGQSKNDLPIGVQSVARFGREDVLIRLASAFEQIMPWHTRIPPVHVSK